MPANFKTYEAQARLLAAVVAAHPGLKLDYKAVAQHYGSDTTTSAIEHRFRPVRKQADVLRKFVSNKLDPKDVDILDKDEINKYFGESTPDGIQFQFRSIKKDADTLKHAVNNGEDPIKAFIHKNGSVPATPRKRGKGGKAASAATTPTTKDSTASTTLGASASAGKRKASRPKYKEALTKDDDSSSEVDYDELDVTPIMKKVKTTPNITGGTAAPAQATPALQAVIPTPWYDSRDSPSPHHLNYPMVAQGMEGNTVLSPIEKAGRAAHGAPAAPAAAAPPSLAHTPSDSEFSNMAMTPSQEPHRQLQDVSAGPAAASNINTGTIRATAKTGAMFAVDSSFDNINQDVDLGMDMGMNFDDYRAADLGFETKFGEIDGEI